ncbi:hypothetical protein HHI36_006204 [Cryptolaemus montrouzieri]|uniref:Protein Wnt n=1 Tax=Cryptolaemus montrouzieri TaxID=559131 RepID=A0ABD2NXI2_9CUCU
MAKTRKPFPHPLYFDKTVCWAIPGLSKEQTDLCYREPDTTSAAMKGLQQAVTECQQQFKSQRWNCSSLLTKEKYPYTSPLFKKGNFFDRFSEGGIKV